MKKLLICLLAVCLLVPVFSACNNGVDGDKKVERDPSLTVEPVDLGGDKISILCRNFGANSNSILGYTGEIIYSEENPSTVDEKKREVVEYMEGVYNCEIEGRIIDQGEDISTIISNQISANLRDYDVYFDDLMTSAAVAQLGCALDLKKVPNINLTDAWWDQNAVADLSIENKLYFVCGDINTYDDQGTFCLFFNKNLKEKLTSIADLNFYELASNKKWTFDKFKEICIESQATVDKTGEGTQDEKDQWAFGTEIFNIYVHTVGAGYKIAQKDNKDVPYLTITKETRGTYDILSKAVEFYKSSGNVLVADTAEKKATYGDKCWDETVHKAFLEGRELFYLGGLFNAPSFRKMDDEIGILPVPKSATQDRYYHTVSHGNASFMFLPKNIKGEELEKLGTFLSGISEISKQRVTYEYREVQLKYRDARDSESEEMLDIIFGSRTFDLGAAFNWGNILYSYANLEGSITNRLGSVKSAANQKLQETLKEFRD